MSLLTIVQNVTDRIGLARPSVVVSSTDQQVRQLFAIANEEGISLSQRCDWQALTDEWTFITVAAQEQTNTPIPSDLRDFVANSFFNRDTARPMIGPITPQQWQQLKARQALGRVYLAFRERAGTFLIDPVPTAGETIAYEYLSLNWAMSSAGNGKPAFTSDDDGAFLDEELIIQGIRWRWKAAKGLDYAEDMQTYENNVQIAVGNDGGSTALDIGGFGASYPYGVNIPEGNFGL